VFLEGILKLYDACFMKYIFIAPWKCLHRFDLHIIIRWKSQECKQDMLTLWSFYILLYFAEFCIIFSSPWQSVTISSSLMSLQNMKIVFFFVLACLIVI
jgi:hypothetical protein